MVKFSDMFLFDGYLTGTGNSKDNIRFHSPATHDISSCYENLCLFDGYLIEAVCLQKNKEL